MTVPLPPAARLEGRTLQSGWRVAKLIPKQPGQTGGCFSCSYAVEKGGRRAFLKALDYSQAEQLSQQSGIDTPTALQILIEAYNFERNLLKECNKRRMDRVVIAIEDGSIKVEDGVFGTVNYLIFEEADGDVRSHLAIAQKVELAWILRCLHHLATGVYQLHSADVAHQDLKPSNILVFGGATSKVADLGCASVKGAPCPRDGQEIAGDRTYAPPELLYHYNDPDWSRRRQACDEYHVGSMVVFFFCGLGMTAMILKHLPPEHHFPVWAGTYTQVLPEVRNAFGKAVREFENSVSGMQLKAALREAVTQLCDPDPLRRGHPANRLTGASQYSLERYVALFNLLAQRAEIGILS